MADRYLVAAGTWDASNTSIWSATSGGAPGASAPTAVDAVFMNAASGAVAVTIGTGAVCSAINCLTFTGSIGDGAIEVASNGTAIVIGGTAFTSNGGVVLNLSYSGSTGTRTVSCASMTEANAFNVNVTAGSDTVQFVGNFRAVNLTGFSGTFTIGGNVFAYRDFTMSATATVGANTSTLSFRPTSGTSTITTAGKTFDLPISVVAPGGTVAFADALTMGSTRTFTFNAGTLRFKDGVTTTVGGFATGGALGRFLQSTTPGVQATLSDASGTNSLINTTIQDIAATGGAVWNAPTNRGNVDAGNNSGINFIPQGEAGSRAAMSLGLSLSL